MSDSDIPVQPKLGEKLPIVLNIETKMSQSYLDYAMSVIVARALPDVRDGLKPVHRRILYAMNELSLTSKAKYRKCALVVGEVLGKFHPHGDTAVYNSLARMAQDFSMRYPLIDGQGNFGSIDGDNPAAMRYTECRMDSISDELLADIDKNTVEWGDNYDASRKEPTVLPARLPNLLINGSTGIAVGMATNIPPHNLKEVVQASIHLLENADATIEDLLQFVHGPDFPTGASIYNWQDIVHAYTTGRGSITMRAITEIIEVKGREQIIVTEIPYQVNKATLIMKIAELVRDKRVNGISELRDESDREGMRIVIELKRDFPPQKVLNLLFKYTDLQCNFPMNMLALIDGKQPQLLNLKQVLVEYLKHRNVVVVRRTEFDLAKAKARAHILEGLNIALDHLDAVIDTIRKSKSAEEALGNLMSKFELSQLQSQAILDMQLRRLAALERQKIIDEYQQILAYIGELEAILADPEKVRAIIKSELEELAKKYSEERRTRMFPQPLDTNWNPEDFIPNEETVVMITKNGYVKRIAPDTYRTQRRGGKGVIGMTTKDDDDVQDIFIAQTHDHLLFFTSRGRVFRLPVYEVPEARRVAKGQAIVNLVEMDSDEKATSILALQKSHWEDAENCFITMTTRNGVIKKTALSEFTNIRKTGIIAIKLIEDDELGWVKLTNSESNIIMITKAGQSIRFHVKDVRPMGRGTQGVRGIKLRKNDIVVQMDAVDQEIIDQGKTWLLVIMENGYGKKTSLAEYKVQKRGGTGMKTANVTTKTGTVIAGSLIDESVDELMITSRNGQIIRIPVKGISDVGRVTQGVRLFRFNNPDDKVAAFGCINTKSEVEG
ncbi:MAG: DNA gyrase subunit A [bacterium]